MRVLTFAVILGCAVMPASYGQGTSEFEVRSKIIAMEQVWNQAYKIKDLKVLDRILDDAFVLVDADGRVRTKPEVLADVSESAAIQVVSQALVVHVHGDTTVVTGTYQMSGVERGKPFVRRGRFVDTWLYKSGIWVSIASLLTPIGE